MHLKNAYKFDFAANLTGTGTLSNKLHRLTERDMQ